MATLDDTIRIIIAADDQASAALRGVGSAISGIESGAKSVAQPFADLANAVLAADAALAAVGVTVGTLAVKQAVEFQDSLYLVQKQLGTTGVSINQASSDIEGLAAKYGKNANEVAKSVAGFLAAGFDYQTASSLVTTATRLMIAGELDAGTATDAITKSLAGFRVPASDAAEAANHVGDVLNKIGDISSGKFGEIVQGFERIAPTAKDAGLSVEETAAQVAVLVDVFGSGEIASTALKSGLLSLLNPSKDAAATLKELGVSTSDSNGQLRLSKDIMADLAGKWGTLTDAQKQQTAAVIFGKEQAGAMSALLGDWAKAQDYTAQMLDKTTGAIGSMAREVDGKLKLMSTSIASTDEAWRQMMTHLGERILAGDSLQDLVQSVGGLGSAIKGVVDAGGFDPLIGYAQEQFGKLQGIIDQVAKNLPSAFEGVDWSGVLDSLDSLGSEASKVFSGLFGEVDLTTVDGLRSAIQTTVDTIESLIRATQGIAIAFEPVASAIGETVRHFNDLDTASKVDFGQSLGSAKALIDAGIGLGAALIAIGQAGASMKDALDIAFGDIKVIVNGVQIAFDVALSAILGALKILPDSVLKYLGTSSEGIDKALQGLSDAAMRNGRELKAGWDQAMGDSSESTQALRDSLDSARASLDKVGSVAQSAGSQVQAAFGQSFDFTGWTQGLDAAETSIVDATDSVMRGFQNMASGMGQSAGAVAGLMGSMSEAAPTLQKTGDATEKLGSMTARLVDGVMTYTQTARTATAATSDHAAKVEDATKKAEQFALEMEKIASNERIKTIEFAVELKTAQMETDMERVKATFESINTGITSTGDTIASLFNNYTNAGSMYEKFNIEEQLAKENKWREQNFALQKDLAQAEIERINEQTKALARGDALIRIDGSGLAPELEAFMWKILKAIRVRANAEFSDYLLGMGAT